MTTNADFSEQAWSNPPSIYRGAPFWSWNDRLVPERLCRQIDQMHAAGMGGFFMHSRYGLKTPYLSAEWFECVAACVEKARQLDMKAYLYDEDRWPSGAAGGIVTRDRPDLGSHVLAALAGEDVPGETERVASFAADLDEAGRVRSYRLLEEGQHPHPGERAISFAAAASAPSPWYNEGAYLDVLSEEAVAQFVRVTHQAYADRFGKDFGDLIPAIFTDEPNYSPRRPALEGAIALLAWTGQLPRAFREARGYDVRDRLVELVYPSAGGDQPAFSKVRHDFYRTVAELFVRNFSVQIGQWCQRNHIALTGHYNAEGTLYSQTTNIGSAMAHYPHQQWPGIDILTDQRHEISTAKQCSSVAAQMGHARVLSELYGCTGWDWPLEGHKFNGGWQYALGVNFRCPHLSLYSLAGGAKRDYPASLFPHSPWWKYYRAVEDYFARLGLALTQGRAVRDVLLVSPIESAWGLCIPGKPETMDRLQRDFDALMLLLLDQHYDYDLGDEAVLAEHARAGKGGLTVGKMKYRLVIVPPALTLRSGTVELLNRVVSADGAVVFVGKAPARVDGRESDAPSELAERAVQCRADPEAVLSTLEDLLPRRVSIRQDGREAAFAWAMLRKVAGGQLLFVQSCDRASGQKVRCSVQARRPAVLWDAATGLRRRLEGKVVGDRVEFDLDLAASGSALVSLGLPVREAAHVARPLTVVYEVQCPGPWRIALAEPNSFPLDTCRFRVGEGQFSEPIPVLLADEKIREHFGLPRRANSHCQPWYLAQTGRADRASRGMCELAFAFHVTDPPQTLRAAIERPEDYQIMLNGRQVANTPVGSWVDEDLKTVDLAPAVQAGRNELLLRFDYRSDMELEDLHLVGEFGVRQTHPKRTHDAYTLTRPPETLPAGSWVGSGLDFYGGAVNYRLDVPAAVWEAISAGRRVRLSLPAVKCTCAAVHVGEHTFVLPWPPMAADITEALLKQSAATCAEIVVEVIGGRKNILGPLHAPWIAWTGPEQFDPHYRDWTDEYLLNDHGLMSPPVFHFLQ